MTSPIITCPHCSKRFKGRTDLQGKRIKCPFCAVPFMVPLEEVEAVPTPQAKVPVKPPVAIKPADPPRSAKLDDDDDENPNPYGVTTPDLAPRCPHCAKELESADAIICLHCGYNTQTRAMGKTAKVLAHTAGEHFQHLLPGILCVLFILLQTIFVVFYCLVLPQVTASDSWWRFANHESMRLWTVVFSLFDIWPIGIFAFNRLVINPLPPEDVKD